MGLARAVLEIRRWLCLQLLAAALAPVAAAAAEPQVLVVYSTRRDAQIVTVGERELPLILEKRLGAVDYYSEYIDDARFPQPGYQAAFRDFLRLKYQNVRFSVIVAVQDPAVELLTAGPDRTFPDIPIVFFSSSPAARRIEGTTGLVGELNFSATLSFLAQVQPEVRQVFVVTGAAPSDLAYEQLARRQLQPFASRFTITYLNGLATRELESRLASLPPRSAVYYLMVNRNSDGKTVHPLEYLERLTALANAPVYCWVDSAIGHGIVGGNLKDQTVQLQAVGQLAVRVLSGEVADSIPVSSPNLNVNQVDWRQLRRWRISEGRLPQGTRILFEEPSVWD